MHMSTNATNWYLNTVNLDRGLPTEKPFLRRLCLTLIEEWLLGLFRIIAHNVGHIMASF